MEDKNIINTADKEISKIRIDGQDYDIKDAELREMIRKFIGDLDKETEERKKVDGDIK